MGTAASPAPCARPSPRGRSGSRGRAATVGRGGASERRRVAVIDAYAAEDDSQLTLAVGDVVGVSDQRKEIGKILDQIRVNSIKRKNSSNNKIYYDGLK